MANKTTHRIYVTFKSSGHWTISMTYRGKDHSTVTTNSMAVDAYKSGEKVGYITPTAAWKELYNEIKRDNDLR